MLQNIIEDVQFSLVQSEALSYGYIQLSRGILQCRAAMSELILHFKTIILKTVNSDQHYYTLSTSTHQSKSSLFSMGSCTSKNDQLKNTKFDVNNCSYIKGSISDRKQRPPRFENLREHSAQQFHIPTQNPDQSLNILLDQDQIKPYQENPLVHSPLKQFIKYQIGQIEQKKRKMSIGEQSENIKQPSSSTNDSYLLKVQESRINIKVSQLKNGESRLPQPYADQSKVFVNVNITQIK